jgi:hypothetical protein
MSTALYRLAGMSYRHRRLVLIAWLLSVFAALGAEVAVFSGDGRSNPSASPRESRSASSP